jgi:hypothetical protein
MVSKLLLAVCETYYRAAESGAASGILGQLAAHYYDIRAGIGLNKDPEVYGAFPTDPYSHTPGNRGAQQPGMTGQVKEDILARWGELGLVVRDGALRFFPILLRRVEFLNETGEFVCVNVHGERNTWKLGKGSLGFTYCQVPVIYHLSEEPKIAVHLEDHSVRQVPGLALDRETSSQIFKRSGTVVRLEVWLNPGL